MIHESSNLKNALAVLDKACAEYVGNRADHRAIETAFATVLNTLQSLQEEVRDLKAARTEVPPDETPGPDAPAPALPEA